MNFVVIILPALCAISAAICYVVAERKKRNKVMWVLLATCIGPVAVAALCVMPSKATHESHS